MQYQLDNMNQTYTSEEIKQILLYVKELQEENETMRAQLMMLMAKLDNEEAKTRRLTFIIQQQNGMI